MKITGAALTMRLLERQGVDTVPGIPGGANLPLYDALRDSGIRHVLARHEQGAGFIAQGMARATGRPAVVQDTGFDVALPVGEGLLAFRTSEEAADALQRVARDYERHSRAAQAIAREHFRAETVLGALLERAA